MRQNLYKKGVSVVIPVYNRKEKLLKAVDSVVTNYPDQAEIIVVDDDSECYPGDYLPKKNASDVKIRCYKNFKNSGPQVARNMGIRRASFEYVAFLDSDDLFFSSKIDWLLAIIASEDFDLLYHGVLGCDKYNIISSKWHNSIGRFIHFKWFICLLNPCVTPSVVIKRKIKLFNPSLRYAEDYAFILSYIDGTTKVKYYSEIQTEVPRTIGSQGGISANLIKMRIGEFKGKKNILRRKEWDRYLAYTLSFLAGSARVLHDLMKKRYTLKEFIKQW